MLDKQDGISVTDGLDIQAAIYYLDGTIQLNNQTCLRYQHFLIGLIYIIFIFLFSIAARP